MHLFFQYVESEGEGVVLGCDLWLTHLQITITDKRQDLSNRIKKDEQAFFPPSAHTAGLEFEWDYRD